MNREPRSGRRRTLFLSYLYPSFFGSGTQIRAAALLRMLAEREEVYLLLINRYERVPGPEDHETEKACRKVRYLRLLPGAETGGKWHEVTTDVAWARIPHLDCESGQIAGAIKRFYAENDLNALFVFRIESYFLMEGSLDLFPVRDLDLDELTSRRNSLIADLKSEATSVPDPMANRAHAVVRVIEKKIIPSFAKVFASSEFEATEARKLAGSDNIHVLPNIFPPRDIRVQAPATNPREILFVGTLSYFPNEDAVRYFCRDIFPLIRRELGEKVIFRIVGFACPKSLRVMAEECPGVEMMGFQEDLEPFYASASLLVVPLRAGTGTRIKILEAFVYERPVVSTSIGAQGLKVADGENILLANEPEVFAQACLKILAEPKLAARLVDGGRNLYQNAYSPTALSRLYDEIEGEPTPA